MKKTINNHDADLKQALLDAGFVATSAGDGCIGFVQNIGSLEVWISDVDHPHVPESFPCGIRALTPEKNYEEVSLNGHNTILNDQHLHQILSVIKAIDPAGHQKRSA